MDLTEALRFISKQAETAAGATNKVSVVALPQEPPGTYGIVKADGTIEKVIAAPLPRAHRLMRVDQVPDFIIDARDRLSAKPTVWFHENGVVILLHDQADSRRESQVSVTFEKSPQFETLESCGDAWRDPKQFSAWIRTELLDALRGAKGFTQLLKSLSFRVEETGKSNLSQGRESIGREVDAEISSEFGELPETVIFDVRVFSDPSLIRRQPIECALDVDPRKCLLKVQPLAGQLQTAIDEELGGIAELLKKNVDCPVYHGRP
jgi:hypothetical protein